MAMVVAGENLAGAGLWSTTGITPPSPRPAVGLNIAADQPPVAPVAAPKISTPGPRSAATQAWKCSCSNFCYYCTCARCCCPCTWCRFFYWLCTGFFIFLLAIGIIVLVMWKVLHPKFPTFNVTNAQFMYTVTGSASTSVHSVAGPSSYVLTAETIIQMTLTNPNTKIGINYDEIALNIQLLGMLIGNQIIPPFYDGYMATSIVNFDMMSGPVLVSTDNFAALSAAQSAGKVPINFNVLVKVRVRIAKLVTPQLKVGLACLITIDPTISSGSQITGTTCKFKILL